MCPQPFAGWTVSFSFQLWTKLLLLNNNNDTLSKNNVVLGDKMDNKAKANNSADNKESKSMVVLCRIRAFNLIKLTLVGGVIAFDIVMIILKMVNQETLPVAASSVALSGVVGLPLYIMSVLFTVKWKKARKVVFTHILGVALLGFPFYYVILFPISYMRAPRLYVLLQINDSILIWVATLLAMWFAWRSAGKAVQE